MTNETTQVQPAVKSPEIVAQKKVAIIVHKDTSKRIAEQLLDKEENKDNTKKYHDVKNSSVLFTDYDRKNDQTEQMTKTNRLLENPLDLVVLEPNLGNKGNKEVTCWDEIEKIFQKNEHATILLYTQTHACAAEIIKKYPNKKIFLIDNTNEINIDIPEDMKGTLKNRHFKMLKTFLNTSEEEINQRLSQSSKAESKSTPPQPTTDSSSTSSPISSPGSTDGSPQTQFEEKNRLGKLGQLLAKLLFCSPYNNSSRKKPKTINVSIKEPEISNSFENVQTMLSPSGRDRRDSKKPH